MESHPTHASDVTSRKLAQIRAKVVQKNEKLSHMRHQIARKNREITRLRAALGAVETRTEEGPRPENIIWVFGTARTGSTWLSNMLGDPPENEEWREPQVGDLFGTHFYERLEARGVSSHWERFYVLGNKEARTNSIRAFVLAGARTRFPEMAEKGYLIIKEPHGSIGAPLLAEALPESRMVFLIRDPRDVASSHLKARQKGGWLYERRYDTYGGEETLGNVPPDDIVREAAEMYSRDASKAREAYEAHEGDKVLVRYEDLRTDCLGTMKRIYHTLNISVDERRLAQTVDRHSFENIPERAKGQHRIRRKATPGGWRQDLTPEQARAVERVTAPLLDEYYRTDATPYLAE